MVNHREEGIVVAVVDDVAVAVAVGYYYYWYWFLVEHKQVMARILLVLRSIL